MLEFFSRFAWIGSLTIWIVQVATVAVIVTSIISSLSMWESALVASRGTKNPYPRWQSKLIEGLPWMVLACFCLIVLTSGYNRHVKEQVKAQRLAANQQAITDSNLLALEQAGLIKRQAEKPVQPSPHGQAKDNVLASDLKTIEAGNQATSDLPMHSEHAKKIAKTLPSAAVQAVEVAQQRVQPVPVATKASSLMNYTLSLVAAVFGSIFVSSLVCERILSTPMMSKSGLTVLGSCLFLCACSLLHFGPLPLVADADRSGLTTINSAR